MQCTWRDLIHEYQTLVLVLNNTKYGKNQNLIVEKDNEKGLDHTVEYQRWLQFDFSEPINDHNDK